MTSNRFAKIAGLLFVVWASDAFTAGTDSDYKEILRKAVVVLNRQNGTITNFVAPIDAKPDLVAALNAVAKVVPRSEVPTSALYTLPRGYFVVEEIHYGNGTGEVIGVAGPGALKGTLGADSDCGMRYSINFEHTGKVWENGSYKMDSCVPAAILGERSRKLRSDAEDGNAEAQFRLGLLYHSGDDGLPKDATQAAFWHRKAAEQGHAEAQVSLAYSLAAGQGVEKNEVEAVTWYRKAALSGNAIAQNYLGGMYYKGQGVKQDFAEAARWDRKAAEQGNVEAELILGLMLEGGIGVTKNLTEAAVWYRKAADSGSDAAKTRLSLITAQH